MLASDAPILDNLFRWRFFAGGTNICGPAILYNTLSFSMLRSLQIPNPISPHRLVVPFEIHTHHSLVWKHRKTA